MSFSRAASIAEMMVSLSLFACKCERKGPLAREGLQSTHLLRRPLTYPVDGADQVSVQVGLQNEVCQRGRGGTHQVS